MLLVQQANPQLPIGPKLYIVTYCTCVVDVGVSTRWIMSDMEENRNSVDLTPIRMVPVGWAIAPAQLPSWVLPVGPGALAVTSCTEKPHLHDFRTWTSITVLVTPHLINESIQPHVTEKLIYTVTCLYPQMINIPKTDFFFSPFSFHFIDFDLITPPPMHPHLHTP